MKIVAIWKSGGWWKLASICPNKEWKEEWLQAKTLRYCRFVSLESAREDYAITINQGREYVR
jgi:hypothetical protein